MPSQPLRSSSSNLLQRINTSEMTASRYNPLSRISAVTEIPARHDGGVTEIPDSVSVHHTHTVRPNQCCSVVIQQIAAPLATVWSVVRRFDNPQAYKHFLTSCDLLAGNGTNVGTLRQVHCVSGLPAENSTERLEILDEEKHVISFSVVGGDHRLANYRSVTTLHTTAAGDGTTVVESYVVDIPSGNTREETRVFVDTIVKCNLQSLNKMSANLPQPN